MTNTTWAVRPCGALALIALIGIAACSTQPNPVAPTASSNAHAGHSLAPASASAAGAFDVGAQLADVRQATEQFHDIAAAYAAGYTTEFEPCVEIPGGLVMGVHARHDAMMADQVVDPLRPELLVYEPRPGGGLKLVGVEYFQEVLVDDGDPNTNDAPVRYFGAEPPPANRIVGPTPQLFGRQFDGPMEGHTPFMAWHWDLHAWIWHANPDGVFAPFNRTVRCR